MNVVEGGLGVTGHSESERLRHGISVLGGRDDRRSGARLCETLERSRITGIYEHATVARAEEREIIELRVAHHAEWSMRRGFGQLHRGALYP